jgi:hypothetical protein
MGAESGRLGCTRYIWGGLYQVHGFRIVPGTESIDCTRYKEGRLCLVEG